MNKMADVVKLLGVELDKEFIAKYPNGRKVRCKFRENDFHSSDTGKLWGIGTDVLYDLIMGSCTIHKLPWKARKNEKYFISDPATTDKYAIGWGIANDEADVVYNRGLMCKTKEQAVKIADAMIKVAREMQGVEDNKED